MSSAQYRPARTDSGSLFPIPFHFDPEKDDIRREKAFFEGDIL
jgi:hypothetical protein